MKSKEKVREKKDINLTWFDNLPTSEADPRPWLGGRMSPQKF
jgi:hypothetical protein